MENKTTFTYQYSATQSREVENIRKKYLPREESKIEILKRLDRTVQSAGQTEGICVGVIGALVFGIGMCFGLDVFTGADWLTLLFCAVGAALMAPAYPIYRHIYTKTKAALSPKILQLSDEIIKS